MTACHRALADAQAAGHVFVTLVGRLQERGITRLGEARAFVSPTSRSALDKLRLTRDVPRSPGTYRFVDKHGAVLYVGKADRLRERVRSYFVPGGGHTRKLRQAVHLVERIDWDETFTPLEAVVREQELILEHKPPCNVQGSRPENYTYLKVGDTGSGLSLTMSTRQPRWLAAEDTPPGHRARPWSSDRSAAGPGWRRPSTCFTSAIPSAAAPAAPSTGPASGWSAAIVWVRARGEPRVVEQHDALVMGIVRWLAGRPAEGFADPLDRADELVLLAVPATALRRRSAHARSQGPPAQRETVVSVAGGSHVPAVRRALAGGGQRRRRGPALEPRLERQATRGGVVCRARRVAEEIEKRLDGLWAASPVLRPREVRAGGGHGDGGAAERP